MSRQRMATKPVYCAFEVKMFLMNEVYFGYEFISGCIGPLFIKTYANYCLPAQE